MGCKESQGDGGAGAGVEAGVQCAVRVTAGNASASRMAVYSSDQRKSSLTSSYLAGSYLVLTVQFVQA